MRILSIASLLCLLAATGFGQEVNTFAPPKTYPTTEREPRELSLVLYFQAAIQFLLYFTPQTDMPTSGLPSTVMPSTVMPSTVMPSTAMPSTVMPSSGSPGGPGYSGALLNIVGDVAAGLVAESLTTLSDDPLDVAVEGDASQTYLGDSELAMNVDFGIELSEADDSSGRRRLEFAPTYDDVLAAVAAPFDSPDKLVDFQALLKEAAEEEGLDGFEDLDIEEEEIPEPINPVIPCTDSTRDFLINEELKNCKWVAKENTEFRCSKGKGGVATHCPATCGTCDRCNDAVKQFMTLEKGLHDCKWVGAKGNAGPIPQRCKQIGDKSTCRSTCGTCSNGPACLDSTQPFLVNEIKRSCGWVAGAPATKCLKGKVASHCPVTCGVCENGCKNSGASFMVNDLGKFKTCKWVGTMSTNIRCAMIGEDNGLSTCPEFCGGC